MAQVVVQLIWCDSNMGFAKNMAFPNLPFNVERIAHHSLLSSDICELRGPQTIDTLICNSSISKISRWLIVDFC